MYTPSYPALQLSISSSVRFPDMMLSQIVMNLATPSVSMLNVFNKYNLRTILAIDRPDTANYYTAGDTFDLGGRTLSAIALYGHTAGSTGMIDSKTGYLFCGDALVPVDAGLLMNLPESITIAEYREHLIELQKLVDDGTVTELFSGHSDTFMKLDRSS